MTLIASRTGIIFRPEPRRLAVTTSPVLKRRWAAGRDHVIDPRTGDTSRGDLVQVTVVAESGAAAESAATAALLLGTERTTAWSTEPGPLALLMTAEDMIITEGSPALVGVPRG